MCTVYHRILSHTLKLGSNPGYKQEANLCAIRTPLFNCKNEEFVICIDLVIFIFDYAQLSKLE